MAVGPAGRCAAQGDSFFLEPFLQPMETRRRVFGALIVGIEQVTQPWRHQYFLCVPLMNAFLQHALVAQRIPKAMEKVPAFSALLRK